MTKFRARRAENKLVGHRWLLKNAREIFSKVYLEYPTAFTFSQGWLQGFLKRNGVSWIRITRQATKLPADYERYIKNLEEYDEYQQLLWEGSKTMQEKRQSSNPFLLPN
jgi:hypothetical protein